MKQVSLIYSHYYRSLFRIMVICRNRFVPESGFEKSRRVQCVLGSDQLLYYTSFYFLFSSNTKLYGVKKKDFLVFYHQFRQMFLLIIIFSIRFVISFSDNNLPSGAFDKRRFTQQRNISFIINFINVCDIFDNSVRRRALRHRIIRRL